MSRKNIKVLDMINFVNEVNWTSGDNEAGYQARVHFGLMLEHFLHRTGNYEGYRYLRSNEITKGVAGLNPRPGINHSDECELTFEQQFMNTDSSRRQYLISSKLLGE